MFGAKSTEQSPRLARAIVFRLLLKGERNEETSQLREEEKNDQAPQELEVSEAG